MDHGKTRVRTVCDDNHNGEWKKCEEGYADGYIRGGNDIPYVAVVLGQRIVLVPPHPLEVMKVGQKVDWKNQT